MFNTKYTISLLDSKWSPLKTSIKLMVIPRSGEFVYVNGQYYEVLNVIHSLDKKHNVFIIVKEYDRLLLAPNDDYENNIKINEKKLAK